LLAEGKASLLGQLLFCVASPAKAAVNNGLAYDNPQYQPAFGWSVALASPCFYVIQKARQLFFYILSLLWKLDA
jgi:hypothetical protein